MAAPCGACVLCSESVPAPVDVALAVALFAKSTRVCDHQRLSWCTRLCTQAESVPWTVLSLHCRAGLYGKWKQFAACESDGRRLMTMAPECVWGSERVAAALYSSGHVAGAKAVCDEALAILMWPADTNVADWSRVDAGIDADAHAAWSALFETARSPKKLHELRQLCQQRLTSVMSGNDGAANPTVAAAATAATAAADADDEAPATVCMSERFPSIPHLPCSPEIHHDDSTQDSLHSDALLGEELVVTEKLDGGNCCLMHGRVYARTHKHEATHASFGPIKELYATIQYDAVNTEYGPDLALFGENMVGIHSIEYDRLHSYFYLFGAFSFRADRWLSWDEVVRLAHQLRLSHAPIVFRGRIESMAALERLLQQVAQKPSQVSSHHPPEGCVVRVSRAFSNTEFDRCVAKYVRKGHVQTDDSWLRTWRKATLETQPECSSEVVEAGSASVASSAASSTVPAPRLAPALDAKQAKDLAKMSKAKLKLAPSLIMTCGLPGSGKSTFSAGLAASGLWDVISKDDIGSRQATEEKFAQCYLRKGSAKRAVIDMCNVAPADRAAWLDFALRPADAVVVYFDVSADVCKQRVKTRANHPTGDLFTGGKGEQVIDGFAKKLVVPTVAEGFQHVYTVRGVEDVHALLHKWCGVVNEVRRLCC
jgi:hypothetical protein